MNCCSARKGNNHVQVAVSHFGVSLFEKRILHEIFPWKNILRISSRRNKFILMVKHQRTGRKTELEFKLSNTRICKDFWQLCRDYHAFFTSAKSVTNPANHTPVLPIKRNNSSNSLKGLLCLSPPSPAQPGTSITSVASSLPIVQRSLIHTNSVPNAQQHNVLLESGDRSNGMFNQVRTLSSELVGTESGVEDARSRTNSFDRALDRFLINNSPNNSTYYHKYFVFFSHQNLFWYHCF